jgi:hypothetical protein
MTLNSFASGVNTSFSSELNDNFDNALSLELKNHVRTLINRAGVYGVDTKDLWGEAYTSITGRNASVNTDRDNTNSAFINPGESVSSTGTNRYAHGITISTTGSNTSADTSSVDNFFDGDDTTYAYGTTERANGSFASYVGRTFTSTAVTYVRVKMTLTAYYTSGGEHYVDARLEKYNGSSWSTVYTFPITTQGTDGENIIFDGWVAVNDTVQGLRIAYNVISGASAAPSSTVLGVTDSGSCAIFYTMGWGVATTTGSLIEHAIPSGTFSSTISSAILSPIVANWEAGAAIEYKLTNASEDTGWLNADTVSSFTAFTSQPTKVIIRLVPKSSSPTVGYPAIRGFGVYAL